MNIIFKVLKSSHLKKIYRFFFRLLELFPTEKQLVIFESFHGKQYSDSPRAIYEYMNEHVPSAKLLWSVDRRYTRLFEELGIPYIKRFSLKWFWLMPRAKYWVNNVRLPNWIPKPKKTIYVQTWHGTPLKRLGIDIEEVHMPGTDTKKYKKNFTGEAKNWDYLVSPNAYSTEIFKRAFDYRGKILETGYPRNDFLYTYNENNVKEIKERLGIPSDKKVILYAPTWRDDQYYSVGKYKFRIQLDLNQMKKKLGENYVILLRMHYLVFENFDLSKYKGFAYDVSSYLDIRDLYIISDLLITDYSSVFFDYANLKRPILFYVYDLDEYRDRLRGFYFDLEQNAPGPLTKTTDEVIAEIIHLEKNNFKVEQSFNHFYNKFCALEDGHAAERVVRAFYKE